MTIFAFVLSAVMVFVPLDDRPVTYQLPMMLGRIAGTHVVAPPRTLLGNYLTAGQPDAIIAWLNSRAPRTNRYVISNDMLEYGGLVASRVPGVTYSDAYFRAREYDTLRRRAPHAWIGAFGTVMRLAPTGIPALGPAANFFAPYPTWQYIQDYANLHDPPLPNETARAQHLARLAGPALDAYLQTRARDAAVDRLLIARVADGTIDRGVLGQDDAKAFGLHVKELQALRAFDVSSGAGDRLSIEPGADELGMALVANALARNAHWRPHIGVVYSTPAGAAYQDPLEFAPIGVTVDSLIALCGGVRDDAHPDLTLFVRVPATGAALDDALLANITTAEAQGRVAFADVSFEASYAEQGAFAQRLLSSGAASRLDAYSSWNTAANTVGTALAEAIAAGAGRRMHTYDSLAHKTFTFMRFVDDVDFHVDVRKDLNRWLTLQGVTDHTYLLPDIARAVAARNSDLLWNEAVTTLGQLYPGYHIAAVHITLPWNRTFETQLDVAIAPNI